MTGGIATGIAFNRNEAIKKANMQEVRKILDESEKFYVKFLSQIYTKFYRN